MLYTDEKDYVVHESGDTGDSMHKSGMREALAKALDILGIQYENHRFSRPRYERLMLGFCSVGQDGLPKWRRHPNDNRWPVTRDQFKPHFATWILARDDYYMKWIAIYKLIQLKNMGYPSKDIMFWEIPLTEWRVKGARKWYSWIYDLYLLGGVIARGGWIPRWDHDHKKFVDINEDDVSDDVNLDILLLACSMVEPTWITRLAVKLRLKLCPWKLGSFDERAKDNVEGAWIHYFRPWGPLHDGGDGNTDLAAMFIIAKRRVWGVGRKRQ